MDCNLEVEKEAILAIGNGASVLQDQYGAIIDSMFKDVLRINDYQTSNYEKFIGSKTTIWGRSNSKKTKDRAWGKYYKVIVASPEWNFNTVPRLIKGKENAFAIPKEHALALQKELSLPGRVVRKGLKVKRGWPSTGLIILNYLISQYPIVYIHGFDCFVKEGGEARHYYNSKEKMQNYYVHDSSKEKVWINKNIEGGKIKLLSSYISELS